MKESGGTVDPAVVRRLLEQRAVNTPISASAMIQEPATIVMHRRGFCSEGGSLLGRLRNAVLGA